MHSNISFLYHGHCALISPNSCQTRTSLHFKRKWTSRHTSVCSRIGSMGVTISARGKAKDTAKHQRKIQDAKDFSWLEPLQEYEAEKQAVQAQGPVEPHMLHAVWRIKPLKGRPWWEKDIMKKFGLGERKVYPVILKNIPSVNQRLVEVKHLVKIRPLTFPHGFPKDPSDYEHTILKTSGEFIVKQRLGPVPSLQEEASEGDPRAKWRLTQETVNSDCERRKLMYKLQSEYHRPEYEYKRNQDGKEYRYNFNKPGA